MQEIRVGDNVTSINSLWKGDIATVISIHEDIIHVVFPETDKHCSYPQSFTKKELKLCIQKNKK